MKTKKIINDQIKLYQSQIVELEELLEDINIKNHTCEEEIKMLKAQEKHTETLIELEEKTVNRILFLQLDKIRQDIQKKSVECDTLKEKIIVQFSILERVILEKKIYEYELSLINENTDKTAFISRLKEILEITKKDFDKTVKEYEKAKSQKHLEDLLIENMNQRNTIDIINRDLFELGEGKIMGGSHTSEHDEKLKCALLNRYYCVRKPIEPVPFTQR